MRLAEELKDAVLQAAVTGALTVSNENDTPVNKSVERIPQQKEELRIKKKARKDAAFGDISQEEITFDIPETWTWLRIGDIGIYKKGPFGSSLTKSLFVPRSTNSVKIYEQKNAIQKDYSLGDYYITKDYYKEKMEGFSVEAGDIIVSCAGTIGEIYILPEDATPGIINQALMRMNIVQEVNINYFLIYFDHVLKQNAKRASKGTAIKNIPAFEVFKKMLFPFPPIEEQQRIVDRVDELMEQIDEYAKIEQKLITLKESFPGDLRSAILRAAMQGKLTERPADNMDVDALIRHASSERKLLIDNKDIKNEKLAEISDEDYPYEIPDSWRFIRLGEVIRLQSGQDMTPDMYSDVISEGVPYLTGASNIDNGRVIINRWTKSPKAIAEKGDLLLTCKGTVGLLAFLNEEQVHIARQIMSIKPLASVNLGYIKFCIDSFILLLKAKAKSEIPGIDRKVVLNLLIPLPTIEEQGRIVGRLEALLPLCESVIEE